MYSRADVGSQLRRYVCREVRGCTGLCDAPPVPAELVETHVLNHLDVFVGSVEDWLREKASEQTVEQKQRMSLIDRERAVLADLDRQRDLHLAEYRRLVEDGHRLAYLALEEVERIESQRDQQQQAISEAEAVAAEWTGSPDLDATLDYYNKIVGVIQGRIKNAEGARQLGQALSSVLAGLWMEFETERDRLLVQFALHDQQPVRLAGGVEMVPELRRDRLWLPPVRPGQWIEPREIASKPQHSRTSMSHFDPSAGVPIPPLAVQISVGPGAEL